MCRGGGGATLYTVWVVRPNLPYKSFPAMYLELHLEPLPVKINEFDRKKLQDFKIKMYVVLVSDDWTSAQEYKQV